MRNEGSPARYHVRVDKDGKQVMAAFDASVPVGSGLLAYFALLVNGNNLTSDFLPGQTEYNGTRYATLADATQDAAVTLSISTNDGWSANGEGTLRGSVERDTVFFESE